MKRLNQFGIGSMGVLLLLAIGLLVIGSGVLVYAKNHNGALPFSGTKATPVKYDGSDTSTSPNGIPGGATGANGTPVSNSSTTVLVKIPDAGVQITVPNSLRDLTWHVNKDSSGKATATFSTKTLTSSIPACAADQGRGAFDLIVRGNGSYPGAVPYSGAVIKQYSGYYTAYELQTEACAKNLTPEQQSLLDGQAQDFDSSVKTVQPC